MLFWGRVLSVAIRLLSVNNLRLYVYTLCVCWQKQMSEIGVRILKHGKSAHIKKGGGFGWIAALQF